MECAIPRLFAHGYAYLVGLLQPDLHGIVLEVTTGQYVQYCEPLALPILQICCASCKGSRYLSRCNALSFIFKAYVAQGQIICRLSP